MFHKALWTRNKKLGNPAVWAMYIVLFFSLPFTIFGQAQNLATAQERYGDAPSYYNFPGESIALFMILLTIGLASLLIGQERSTHSTDFTFSLPFNRKDIFLSKWIFGAVHITASLLINLFISFLIIKFSIISQVTDTDFLIRYTIFIIPFSIAIFTFSMLIGTLTGNMVSQFILSGIFLFFPIGFYSLVSTFLTYNGIYDFTYNRPNMMDKIISSTTLPYPILNFSYYVDIQNNNVPVDWHPTSYWTLITPLLYLTVSLVLGVWLFSRTKNENNGKLLIFNRGKRFFMFGVVLCFSLVGGMIGGGILGSYGDPNLVGYYFSAAIGGLISYLVLSKIINVQLRLNR